MITDRYNLYEKGNHWFKRFIDNYRHKKLILEPHPEYPYARIYYNNPKYKLLMADVELNMKEFNHYKKMQRDLLYSDKSFYQKIEAADGIKQTEAFVKTVRGYWGHKDKLDRRLQLLTDNQEFLSTSLQNAKSML